MKVCPHCRASLQDGYVYCPRDGQALVSLDLRATLQVARARQQAQARALQLLLPQASFCQHLGQALHDAAREFRHHPQAFLRALWCGEPSSARRNYLLQSGAAIAVIVYCALFSVSILLGWLPGTAADSLTPAIEKANADAADLTTPLILPVFVARTRAASSATRGHLGGSLTSPPAQRAHGGGSGGDRSAQPASGGVMPRASLQTQLLLPDPAPPRIAHPSLPVVSTLVADPKSVRFVPGDLGLTGAPPAPPSKGPGKGGGIGNDHGRGVGGKGDGDGAGAGNGSNTGSNNPRLGSGKTTGIGDNEGAPRMASGRLRPTIICREKAPYTEEARQQKTQGAVFLVATFTRDGRVTDIRVLQRLPHGLTEAAIQAAQRIRFLPAQENGQPVSVRAQLEFNFNLY